MMLQPIPCTSCINHPIQNNSAKKLTHHNFNTAKKHSRPGQSQEINPNTKIFTPRLNKRRKTN